MPGSRGAVALAAVALAAAAPAAAARTVRLDGPGARILEEPDVAVDATAPNRVVVVVKDYRGSGDLRIDRFVSTDGGRTFGPRRRIANASYGGRARARERPGRGVRRRRVQANRPLAEYAYPAPSNSTTGSLTSAGTPAIGRVGDPPAWPEGAATVGETKRSMRRSPEPRCPSPPRRRDSAPPRRRPRQAPRIRPPGHPTARPRRRSGRGRRERDGGSGPPPYSRASSSLSRSITSTGVGSTPRRTAR